MEKDYVADAVFEFLENGGDLPDEADKNPQNRFVFQTAMARMTYQRSCSAIRQADDAVTIANNTAIEMKSFREVIEGKMKTVVDMVNVRLGIIGGIIIVASAILALIQIWPK